MSQGGKKNTKTKSTSKKSINLELTDEELQKTSQRKKTKNSGKKKKTPMPKKRKVAIIVAIIIILALIAATVVIFILASQKKAEQEVAKADFAEPIYSTLTGLEIADAALNSSPTFCIQIPNSDDGARPQAGLSQAAVVFEAIAERGITRFAAVFQNPDVSVIGPIRSLRPYYTSWDAPFDCTIVHAGGSDEALAEVGNGNFRNLDVDGGAYAWRENDYSRSWNNLFTSPAELTNYNNALGFKTSEPKAFPRLTLDASANIISERQSCTAKIAAGEECVLDTPTVETFSINFGVQPDYNTTYQYNPESNNYARSFATGAPHLSYDCAPELEQPATKTECGETIQIAPTAVVAMLVEQYTMLDGYHEQIETIGSGNAYIFQNGTVIEGTWQKNSQADQIVFRDAEGNEISFAPGQLWIAAVPNTGGVSY